MATKTKVIGLNAFLKATEKQLAEFWVREQNRLLIEYAKKEIVKLGKNIEAYHSRNHMDRTGNLLNSLCWGVAYDGRIVDSGFYREPITHSRGMDGTSVSFLHEFFPNDVEERNGRQMAENFIASYKGRPNKWTVFFAILADYWGYWESGFTMKSNFGEGRPRFMQFQVMTYIYDDVRRDLRPAKPHLTVYVPKYSYKNPRYKKKRGYKRIGVDR